MRKERKTNENYIRPQDSNPVLLIGRQSHKNANHDTTYIL